MPTLVSGIGSSIAIIFGVLVWFFADSSEIDLAFTSATGLIGIGVVILFSPEIASFINSRLG